MPNAAEQGPTTGVTPHLAVDGAAAAIAFYEAAFGAEELSRMLADDGRRLMHAHLRINGGSVMLHDLFPEYMKDPARPPSAVTMHLQVDDADRWFARAVEAGATVTMPLADQFWGDRYGALVDPFGHSWAVGAPIKGEPA